MHYLMFFYTVEHFLLLEAEDYGGPHKEFFCLIVRKIYETYFENGLKKHLEKDYCTVGICW